MRSPLRRFHSSTHAFIDASISCVDACVGVDSGSAISSRIWQKYRFQDVFTLQIFSLKPLLKLKVLILYVFEWYRQESDKNIISKYFTYRLIILYVLRKFARSEATQDTNNTIILSFFFKLHQLWHVHPAYLWPTYGPTMDCQIFPSPYFQVIRNEGNVNP